MVAQSSFVVHLQLAGGATEDARALPPQGMIPPRRGRRAGPDRPRPGPATRAAGACSASRWRPRRAPPPRAVVPRAEPDARRWLVGGQPAGKSRHRLPHPGRPRLGVGIGRSGRVPRTRSRTPRDHLCGSAPAPPRRGRRCSRRQARDGPTPCGMVSPVPCHARRLAGGHTRDRGDPRNVTPYHAAIARRRARVTRFTGRGHSSVPGLPGRAHTY
jgi:hypothetical protein